MRSVWEVLQPKETAEEPLPSAHRYHKLGLKSWLTIHAHLFSQRLIKAEYSFATMYLGSKD